jgi:CMP-N,N'-diacetyllegionaminic acid synthase
MQKKIVAIIPARKGSKRIKNKNIRLFNGKPLIEWTIAAAKKSKFVDEIYITTNDEEVKIIAKKNKIKVINRPRHLANSFIMPDYAIKHAYLKIKKDFDYIIMLHPTSPLRTSQNIDDAVKDIINSKADSLLSVHEESPFLWEKRKSFYHSINYNFKKRPRSQNFKILRENGAIYITKPEIYIKYNNRLGGKIFVSKINYFNSMDINTEEDFMITESLIKSFI